MDTPFLLLLFGLALMGYGFWALFRGEVKVGLRFLKARLYGPAALVVGAIQSLIGAGMLVVALGSLFNLSIVDEWVSPAIVVGFCGSAVINLVGLAAAPVLKRLAG